MRDLREQAQQERDRRIEFENAMQEKLAELQRQMTALVIDKTRAGTELQVPYKEIRPSL
jgi:hypothetical protein